jgi:hypothetical protein
VEKTRVTARTSKWISKPAGKGQVNMSLASGLIISDVSSTNENQGEDDLFIRGSSSMDYTEPGFSGRDARSQAAYGKSD